MARRSRRADDARDASDKDLVVDTGGEPKVVESVETSSEQATARLLVVDGDHAGTAFPIYHDHILIGRLGSNHLSLKDGSVSRLHARLFLRRGRWHIEDMGSRWGTLVNGGAVEGHRALTPGDEIQIGDVRLSFQL